MTRSLIQEISVGPAHFQRCVRADSPAFLTFNGTILDEGYKKELASELRTLLRWLTENPVKIAKQQDLNKIGANNVVANYVRSLPVGQYVTPGALAEELSVHTRYTYKILSALRKEGVVRSVSRGVYEITNEGQV